MTDPAANDTATFGKWVCAGCGRGSGEGHLPNCPEYRRAAGLSAWPPTSERDAHLGAYKLTCGPCRCEDHDQCTRHESGGRMICQCWCRTHIWEPGNPDAPREIYRDGLGDLGPSAPMSAADTTGLTAAQEIRLRVFETLDRGGHGFEVEELLRVVPTVAAWVEHGPDETPQIRDWATACPDPARHDPSARTALGLQIDALAEWIVDNVPGEPRQSEGAVATAIRVMADLKTELHEAHADLEASRAREQIAQERVAKVLAYLDEIERGELGVVVEVAVRAILAGDQGEEA